MSVHSRSVWDRRATRHLYELLAPLAPPRGSDTADRQSKVTAWLDELYQASPARTLPPGLTIVPRRVA